MSFQFFSPTSLTAARRFASSCADQRRRWHAEGKEFDRARARDGAAIFA
jgi:hypothetical protein